MPPRKERFAPSSETACGLNRASHMTGFHRQAGTVPANEGASGSHSGAGLSARSSGVFSAPSGTGPTIGQPFGYALRASARAGTEEGYDIVVVDRQGSVLLALGPFCEADVVATWRALSATSGLPLLIEHGPGDLRPVCDQIGRMRLGRVRIRRRHAFLGGRRPRFLVRRKPGRVAMPTRMLRRQS